MLYLQSLQVAISVDVCNVKTDGRSTMSDKQENCTKTAFCVYLTRNKLHLSCTLIFTTTMNYKDAHQKRIRQEKKLACFFLSAEYTLQIQELRINVVCKCTKRMHAKKIFELFTGKKNTFTRKCFWYAV